MYITSIIFLSRICLMDHNHVFYNMRMMKKTMMMLHQSYNIFIHFCMEKCYGLRQQKLGHKIVCRQILWPVWTAVMVWSRVTQYCYFVNFLFIVPYELYKCAWWFTLLSRIFRWFKYKSFEFLFTDECQGIAKYRGFSIIYLCLWAS